MAARKALDDKDPDAVLPFVPAAAEGEVRQAFASTLRARAQGGEAAAVADRWFFETVVQLHRAGEGAPFHGLKPAGLDVGPIVPMAEQAILTGQLVPLYKFLANAMHEQLHQRFEHVQSLRQHDPHDIAAARRYTSAMLGFIVWAHSLHQAFGASAHGDAHSQTPAGHSH